MYNVTNSDELQVLADRVIYENNLNATDHTKIAQHVTEITGKTVSAETIAELMTLDVFDEDMVLISQHNGINY